MANRLPLCFAALLLLAAAPAPGGKPGGADAVWRRFLELEGRWRASSTKGWTETLSFQRIARGSALLEISQFDGSSDPPMATVISPDGGRLLLTHYCEAGNQPRLWATSFEPDGETVDFRFLDATNLPSRNRGHMDRVLFRFLDRDHFTSRWTWFQDGEERWMEEISYERVTASPPYGT
jgi:hypothetical protein